MDTVLKFLTDYGFWPAIAIGAIVVMVVLILVIKKVSSRKKNKQKSDPKANVKASQQLQVAEADYEMITERII